MSRAKRRYYRTIFLGVAAMALLVWSAMDQFGISAEEMQSAFFTTVLLIGVIVAGGALAAALWVGLRMLIRKVTTDRSENNER